MKGLSVIVMKYVKNTKVVLGSALIALGVTILLIWFFHSPSREITRAELQQLLEAKALQRLVASPTPYAGIYHVEGTRKAAGKSERVFVTTHLDETQVKSLFEQSGLKVDLPGQGLRG